MKKLIENNEVLISLKSEMIELNRDNSISQEDKKSKYNELLYKYKKQANSSKYNKLLRVIDYYDSVSKHIYFDAHCYVKISLITNDEFFILRKIRLDVNTDKITTSESKINKESFYKYNFKDNGDIFNWKYLYGKLTSVKINKTLRERMIINN